MRAHGSFSETFSFRGTLRDRQRLEALCRQLELTSGELIRALLREKSTQIFVTGQRSDMYETVPVAGREGGTPALPR
jgi:hypothetical protein